MKKPKISIIAAIGENRELGKDNKLLWHIPEDMKRFKKLTKGHVVIMGRKTFESIGKPLPYRLNIIITRDKYYNVLINQLINTIVKVAHSLEEALHFVQGKLVQKKYPGEIFIIGGGQLYKQAIKFADKLYLTIVKSKFDADTFFPDYSEFKKIVYNKEVKTEKYNYTFFELVK